jgi:glycosyltransferase involved in cell wall biosynthesis
MNPKVSVIIPAYNSEKTLKRCLDSVFASDLNDSMEVILVNDGSEDGTLGIAGEFQRYSNFVLIDQPNGGVAHARWVGISASKGKYLGFVDADDYIASDMMSKMYDRARSTGAEIVICGWYKVWNDRIFPFHMYKGIEVEKSEIAIERTIIKESNGSLCNKLIYRKLINENDYNETKGIDYCEDMMLLFLVMRKAHYVAYHNDGLYFYVDNPDSVTRRPSLKAIRDLSFVCEKLFDVFSSSGIAEWKKLSQEYYSKGLISVLRHLCRMEQTIEVLELRKEIYRKLRAIGFCGFLNIKSQRMLFDYILLKMRVFRIAYFVWESRVFRLVRELRKRFIFRNK